MTWALVLGGANCVHKEAKEAIAQFGEPDQIVAVKDIGIEWPKVDHWVSYHVDRMPRELGMRAKLGLPPPGHIWTYQGVKAPTLPIPVHYYKIRGGSSGLLGALVAIKVCDKAVLAGVPMDPTQRHYHNRKNGRAWHEAALYQEHWRGMLPNIKGKVKSMSGFTRELLGAPTKEWVHGSGNSTEGAG